MSETQPRVAIVGAGPAGAALAYLLARNGIATTLLERHGDFAREFRGEALQPSGWSCLEQMGLATQLAAVPQTRIARVNYGLGPGPALDLPVALTDLQQLRLVSQPDLLAMLTAAAAEHPGFELRMSTTVRELTPGARPGASELRLASGERLTADYVVACDGRHSALRRRVGLHLESIEQSFDVLWTRGPLAGPLARSDGAYVELLLGGGTVAIYPAPAGGHQLGIVIRKGGFRELRASGSVDGLDWLRPRCRTELWQMLTAAREQLARPMLLDVVCGRAPCWSAPGVLLLGDAAHPMSPVGGQGINMALRDAVVAANALVPVLRRDGDAAELDAAAAAIEAERRPEIEAIQALQTRQGRGFDRRPGRLGLALMRRVLSLRPVVRAMLRHRATFARGTTEVALAV